MENITSLVNKTGGDGVHSSQMLTELALHPLDWIVVWVTSFVLLMLLIICLVSSVFKADAKGKDLSMGLEDSSSNTEATEVSYVTTKNGATINDKNVVVMPDAFSELFG